jgi:hypothetical protein
VGAQGSVWDGALGLRVFCTSLKTKYLRKIFDAIVDFEIF